MRLFGGGDVAGVACGVALLSGVEVGVLEGAGVGVIGGVGMAFCCDWLC